MALRCIPSRARVAARLLRLRSPSSSRTTTTSSNRSASTSTSTSTPHPPSLNSNLRARPCGATTCDGCAAAVRCLDKHALFQPVPKWLWLAASASAFGALLINGGALGAGWDVRLALWFAGENARVLGVEIEEDEEENNDNDVDINDRLSRGQIRHAALLAQHQADERWLKRSREIFRSVGVVHADRVQVIATESKGPTAFGINLSSNKISIFSPVVFIPQTMLDAADRGGRLELREQFPDGTSKIVYAGPATEFSEEARKELLANHGALFPTADEMDFVLAHEGAHIANQDGLLVAALAVGTLFSATLSLKMWNALLYSVTTRTTRSVAASTSSGTLKAWKVVLAVVQKLPRAQNRHLFPVVALAMAVPAATWLGWAVERRADTTAALSAAGRAATGLALTHKKLEQNQAAYRQGARWASPAGNDWSELQHFPLTMQREYFAALVALQKGDAEQAPEQQPQQNSFVPAASSSAPKT